jgi:hypothetical protein
MDRSRVDEIRNELERLMREHIESMANQTFLGLNPEEFGEQRERLLRIRELSSDYLEALKKLPPAA